MCTEGCKQTQDQVDRLLPSTSLPAILPALRVSERSLCSVVEVIKKKKRMIREERACGRGERLVAMTVSSGCRIMTIGVCPYV